MTSLSVASNVGANVPVLSALHLNLSEIDGEEANILRVA